MLSRGKLQALLGALFCVVLLSLYAAPASGGAAPRCTTVGTAGSDTLRGDAGPDVICGRGGRDQLVGGRGADRLVGGGGDDVLRGGPGADALLGGKGDDACHDSKATVFVSCEVGRSSKRPGKRRAPTRPEVIPPYSEAPDRAAPEAVSIFFQRRFIDTSTGDTTMGVYLEAWDPSGIGSISLKIEGPNGPWRQLQVEGDPAGPRTVVQASVDVPGTTPAGDYRLTSLTISDRKGNTRALTPADLEEAGYRAEFAVFHGPDEEDPVLTSLSLSTAEVDTSSAPATVEISIGASDALSGVNDANVVVVLPNWEPGPLELTGWMGSEVPPTTGTRHDGVWKQPISLVQHAMPGTYKVHGVYLSDLAGNTSHYKREDLEALGFPVEFVQAGAGDTTPPEILDFWFEPDQLRTAAGDRTIFFYTHIRDDLTGVGQWPAEGLSGVRNSFRPAGPWGGQFSTSGSGPKLISGTELDGVWREETVLEADAAPGEYEVTYVGATDRAGNDLLLKRPEIEVRGWPDSFLNLP